MISYRLTINVKEMLVYGPLGVDKTIGDEIGAWQNRKQGINLHYSNKFYRQSA